MVSSQVLVLLKHCLNMEEVEVFKPQFNINVYESVERVFADASCQLSDIRSG